MFSQFANLNFLQTYKMKVYYIELKIKINVSLEKFLYYSVYLKNLINNTTIISFILFHFFVDMVPRIDKN